MDAAWFGSECIPGIAAGIDDSFVAVKDAIAELVLAQVLPDVLDRIELGRIGRRDHVSPVIPTALESNQCPRTGCD